MDIMSIFQSVTENTWIYGGSFLLVLSVLVFVHELGHYAAARMCGVRVDTFSIGFGKELFGFTDSHGTRWKFSLIPLGGFVKMYGTEDEASTQISDKDSIPEDKLHEAFFSKSLLQRSFIVFAGPAINYIYAFIVMAFVFAFMGQPVTPPYASAVIAGSAAEKAGFMPYDEILEIDGKAIQSFEDIRRAVMISLDQERHFTVRRGNDVLTLTAAPEHLEQQDKYGFSNSRGFLGITGAQHALSITDMTSIDGVEYEDVATKKSIISNLMEQGAAFRVGYDGDQSFLIAPMVAQNPDFEGEDYLILSNGQMSKMVDFTPVAAVSKAGSELWDITAGTLYAIGQMFTGDRSATELGGLIRIGTMAGDVAQQGWVALLMFSALLSINLGLINLFPIPVLDGGHLVMYAIEGITGKPVPEKAQDYAFKLGFGILILVMAFANINDVVQLLL